MEEYIEDSAGYIEEMSGMYEDREPTYDDIRNMPFESDTREYLYNMTDDELEKAFVDYLNA